MTVSLLDRALNKFASSYLDQALQKPPPPTEALPPGGVRRYRHPLSQRVRQIMTAALPMLLLLPRSS